MAVKKKPVSFSSSERDQKILQYAETKMSFSVYVKELIEKDIEKEKEIKKPQKKILSLDI
jgi:hypothetical protein